MKWKLKLIVPLALTVGAAAAARADSLTANQIAQEIKQDSVLSLRQNVAGTWAANLLAAQDPSVCDYCASHPDSLQLSIEAVLRAVTLEQTLAGLSFCNLTNCILANSQSMIAINPDAGISLTPSFVDFGEVAVATPEPEEVWLLVLGSIFLIIGLTIKEVSEQKEREEDYSYNHPERKA